LSKIQRDIAFMVLKIIGLSMRLA